jgi:recombination protein RecT
MATKMQEVATQPVTPPPPREVSPIVQAGNGLIAMRDKFKATLPKHIPVERFERTVITAMNLTPELATADRRSLLNAATKAASDGLLPDGREGALVIFNDRKTNKKMVQWMPMVAGIIKKLRQSGEIASIAARVVYQGEIDTGRFKYIIDEGAERLTHEPMLWGDRGKAVLVYATARFKDGTVQNEPMTMADVEKARAVSRTGKSEYGPWAQWTDEMMRKTAIRRLAKYLPLSAEDNRLLHRDEETPTDFEVIKQEAITSAQPQSIEAARQLGAPAEPEIPHDADTGEVIEQTTEPELPEYVPGAEDR